MVLDTGGVFFPVMSDIVEILDLYLLRSLSRSVSPAAYCHEGLLVMGLHIHQ